MTTMTSAATAVIGGVDTHADAHVAVVCDELGAVLGTRAFPATGRGYRQLLAAGIEVIGVLRAARLGTGTTRCSWAEVQLHSPSTAWSAAWEEVEGLASGVRKVDAHLDRDRSPLCQSVGQAPVPAIVNAIGAVVLAHSGPGQGGRHPDARAVMDEARRPSWDRPARRARVRQ
jgi:hypothetical protein